MKRCLVYVLLLTCVSTPLLSAQHTFGLGLHYGTVIDDMDVTDIDTSGISYYFHYRYRFYRPLWLELGLERLPDQFGESVYAPQAFLVIGNKIYAGVGAGAKYTNGSFADEPFYALKAGVSFSLPLWFCLDISAQYRFHDYTDIRDEERRIGTDTVFLGGALRLVL